MRKQVSYPCVKSHLYTLEHNVTSERVASITDMTTQQEASQCSRRDFPGCSAQYTFTRSGDGHRPARA